MTGVHAAPPEPSTALERACEAVRQSLQEALEEYEEAKLRMEQAERQMNHAREDSEYLQGALNFMVTGRVEDPDPEATQELPQPSLAADEQVTQS